MTPAQDPDASTLRLRALAHPLRWQLLDLVASEGTATATRCSVVLGESVASCSYHLGVLGKYGYLAQVTDSPGRERPWRLTDSHQDLAAAGDGAQEALASAAAAEAFLDHEVGRLRSRQRSRALEPAEWQRASGMGGATTWLTAAELDTVTRELMAALERHGERFADPAQRPPGAREVRLFVATSVAPAVEERLR